MLSDEPKAIEVISQVDIIDEQILDYTSQLELYLFHPLLHLQILY